jgi:uncharacterized protein (DUF4415 family)
MSEQDIDLSEIPEITEEQMKRAVLRVGGEPVAKGKVRVNMFLDADIVAYFKAQAGGRGYQTLINDALRTSILADDLETVLSRVVRESLAEYVLRKPASVEALPIQEEERASDPFFLIGSDPGRSGLGDGSVAHDKYLYENQDWPCDASL